MARIKSSRFNTKVENIRKFEAKLLENRGEYVGLFHHCNTVGELERDLEKFYAATVKIAAARFRRKNFKVLKTVSWWTPKLREQRSRIRALGKKLRQAMVDDGTRVRHNRELAQYKKNILRRKRTYWFHLCNASDEKFGTQFKLAQKKFLLPEHLVNTVLDQASGPESRSDVYKRLIEHQLGGVEDEEEEVEDQETLGHCMIEFTNEELDYAISTLKQDKAPGLDLIDVRMVRSINRKMKGLLLRLYNVCGRLESFPMVWKKAEVFFVKKGKDPKVASSYRPICLLPVLSKILEKLMKVWIMYHLDRVGYLHDEQCGFRENRSTESAILVALDHVRGAKGRGDYPALISLDIRRAFDSIDWDTIRSVVRQAPIDRGLVPLVNSYLTNRKVVFMDRNRRVSFKVVGVALRGRVLVRYFRRLLRTKF